MRRSGLAVVLAGALAAVASGATVPNVAGTYEIERSLVCQAGETCDPPAIDATLVFSRSGRVAARKHVGTSGTFSLHLAPGRYAIRVSPAPERGRLSPATVLVPRSRSVRVHLSLGAS